MVLADAGFFYAGFSDCTRCFFCGIGLRNWEDGDIPWIEHARWCPTCDFLRQRKGDLFIQMHRQGNNHEEQYSPEPPRSSGHFDDSMKDMKKAVANTSREEEDIAVSSVLEMGYSRLVVNSAVQHLRTKRKNNYSATDIMEVIFDREDTQTEPNKDIEVKANTTQTASHSRTTNNLVSRTSSVAADGQSLLKENQDLKAQMKCKICLDKDACMVYLPCGHMVTCQDCASTIRKCCICRKLIQGIVKAYM